MSEHKFGFSFDIYFKYSTEINSLSKDFDEHNLVGLAAKWVWP